MNRRKVQAKLTRDFYNKTHFAEDGTQEVDTEHDYTVYKMKVENTYFTENEKELIEYMLEDLEQVKQALVKIKEKGDRDEQQI